MNSSIDLHRSTRLLGLVMALVLPMAPSLAVGAQAPAAEASTSNLTPPPTVVLEVPARTFDLEAPTFDLEHGVDLPRDGRMALWMGVSFTVSGLLFHGLTVRRSINECTYEEDRNGGRALGEGIVLGIGAALTVGGGIGFALSDTRAARPTRRGRRRLALATVLGSMGSVLFMGIASMAGSGLCAY